MLVFVLGLALLLWGGISTGPAKRWKRETWRWEGGLLLRYVAILVGGLAISWGIYPGIFNDMVAQAQTETGCATFWFCVFFLVAWPTGLILMRRRIVRRFDQDKEAHQARMAKYRYGVHSSEGRERC